MTVSLPVRMSAIIRDELGVTAGAFVYAVIDPGASFTAVQAIWQSWLADLDACIDGQIVSAALHVLPALPAGLKGSPASGSRVEQSGVLNFSATGTTHLWAALLPSLSNGTTVISGGKIVLTPGSPVPVLAALLSPAGGSSILEWSNANGQALATFQGALISFRKYAEQLTRLTFET